MASVREPANERDFCQGSLRLREQLRRVLNSADSNQLAQRAAVIFVKLPRQMHVMHADLRGDLTQTEPFQESDLNNLRSLAKPFGGVHHYREVQTTGSQHRSLQSGCYHVEGTFAHRYYDAESLRRECTEVMRVTERFTRRDFGHINIPVKIDD